VQQEIVGAAGSGSRRANALGRRVGRERTGRLDAGRRQGGQRDRRLRHGEVRPHVVGAEPQRGAIAIRRPRRGRCRRFETHAAAGLVGDDAAGRQRPVGEVDGRTGRRPLRRNQPQGPDPLDGNPDLGTVIGLDHDIGADPRDEADHAIPVGEFDDIAVDRSGQRTIRREPESGDPLERHLDLARPPVAPEPLPRRETRRARKVLPVGGEQQARHGHGTVVRFELEHDAQLVQGEVGPLGRFAIGYRTQGDETIVEGDEPAARDAPPVAGDRDERFRPSAVDRGDGAGRRTRLPGSRGRERAERAPGAPRGDAGRTEATRVGRGGTRHFWKIGR